MAKQTEFINGTCQQLLFSPKGGVEGALVKTKAAVVQVTLAPREGAAFLHATGPGKRLRILAVPDHSPKTSEAAHPVLLFQSYADAAGNAIDLPSLDPHNTTIKGTVGKLHFARHGQANGVVLETGEFIHLRPGGMTQTGLKVGSKVSATGEARMTVLGTPMLEAHQVNRIALD